MQAWVVGTAGQLARLLAVGEGVTVSVAYRALVEEQGEGELSDCVWVEDSTYCFRRRGFDAGAGSLEDRSWSFQQS